MDSLTQSPQDAQLTGALKPEWLRIAGAVTLYGIGRSSLYELIAEGKIKSVCLRQRGSARGIRLISADSLSAYLESLATK